MAEVITVQPGNGGATPAPGSAGLNTQLPGLATTVDGLAAATGGVGAGQLMERDIDQDLYEFESDDTPLMQLMLKAKKVTVTSPEVDHYQIDEEKTSFVTTGAVAKGNGSQFSLPLDPADQNICQPYGTLLVRGVNGYDPTGQTLTPGEDLMLFVVGRNTETNNPIVRCVNGPKASSTADVCTTPAIPAGVTIDVLGNALHETQREVEPDSSVPVSETIYLQKRGLNTVVSDYFESQKKRTAFGKALLAERAIRKFKRAGNRTLWASRQGKFTVTDPKTGVQSVYTTKGLLWQFKRVIQRPGSKWTYEEFVSTAKMFFTGADAPSSGYGLCGKNFLESIQCIDFSKHPEVKIDVKQDGKMGWEVTCIHTVFGDLSFKHEPTLDKLGYSNSAALLGADRLVHYQRTSEHKEQERIEGHEASRESVIVWDALALKGSCNMFINGEGTVMNSEADNYVIWTSEQAPATVDEDALYYLINDCPGINANAKQGQVWKGEKNGENTVWIKVSNHLSV